MNKIRLVRIDQLGNIGSENEYNFSILSDEKFNNWDALFNTLCNYKVKISDENRIEIENHPDTNFSHREFVNFGYSAAMINVIYKISIGE